MPIAEIIAEIDAYLSRLRQARQFLSDRLKESPPKRVPSRKGKVKKGPVGPDATSKRRPGESRSRSNHPVAHLKSEMKPVDPGANVPGASTAGAVGKHASNPERSAIAELNLATQQNPVVTRIPARPRVGSIRSARNRTAKPAAGTKPDAIRPAIALAGPVQRRIVVVSAEQIEQQREQAAHSEVRRPRVTSGLTGRGAFEALFSD